MPGGPGGSGAPGFGGCGGAKGGSPGQKAVGDEAEKAGPGGSAAVRDEHPGGRPVRLRACVWLGDGAAVRRTEIGPGKAGNPAG